MAETRLYELLARIRSDRSVALAVRDLTTVNGRDYEGDPRPVTAGDASVVAFVESFNAAAVADREKARVDLETARTEHAAAMKAAVDARETAAQEAAAVLAALEQQHAATLAELTAAKADVEAALAACQIERDEINAAKQAADESLAAATAQIEQLTAEVEALRNPPATPLILTPGEFLRRFTDDELDRIQLTAENPVARKAMRTLFTQLEVRLDNPLLIELMAALVMTEFLTADRAAAIMQPNEAAA